MIFIIPSYSDHSVFINKNYRTIFLKQICRYYKLRISGSKPILVERIYKFLLLSNSVIIMQKYAQRYLRQVYNNLLGPALFKRSLCRNTVDFFTLEDINKLSYFEFISIKIDDNNIWGFNIISLYNLFIKSSESVLNPYTREKLSYEIFNKLKRIIKLSKMFKKPVNVIINNNVNDIISSKKRLELRCLELFQYIDELGNYTKIDWFLSLNKIQLIRFIRELVDIWEYRAQLTDAVKMEICYPTGNPFYSHINLSQVSINNMSHQALQKSCLSVIEQFIKSGINRESNILGATYILCGLTLVNNDAAEALPWLYQSVVVLD